MRHVPATLRANVPMSGGRGRWSASRPRSNFRTAWIDWLTGIASSERRPQRCSPPSASATGRLRHAMWADRPFTSLHRPQLGDEEIAAVTRVIRSGWIAQGAETESFECEFAAFVGAPHAIAVSNGTAALALALAALDVG